MLNEMEKQEIRDHATRWEKGSGFGTIDGRRSPEMIVAQLRGYEFMGCTNGQVYALPNDYWDVIRILWQVAEAFGFEDPKSYFAACDKCGRELLNRLK